MDLAKFSGGKELLEKLKRELKEYQELGLVVHTYSFKSQEAEAEGLRI